MSLASGKLWNANLPGFVPFWNSYSKSVGFTQLGLGKLLKMCLRKHRLRLPSIKLYYLHLYNICIIHDTTSYLIHRKLSHPHTPQLARAYPLTSAAKYWSGRTSPRHFSSHSGNLRHLQFTKNQINNIFLVVSKWGWTPSLRPIPLNTTAIFTLGIQYISPRNFSSLSVHTSSKIER